MNNICEPKRHCTVCLKFWVLDVAAKRLFLSARTRYLFAGIIEKNACTIWIVWRKLKNTRKKTFFFFSFWTKHQHRTLNCNGECHKSMIQDKWSNMNVYVDVLSPHYNPIQNYNYIMEWFYYYGIITKLWRIHTK